MLDAAHGNRNAQRFAAPGSPQARASGSGASAPPPSGAQTSDKPIYYQDPDGKPDYSPVPKKTADGRDYVARIAADGALLVVDPRALAACLQLFSNEQTNDDRS